MGGAKATNDGIILSTGKYLTLLGSDDEYEKEHLSIRVDRMTKADKPDIIHGGFKVIGNHMVADKRDTTKLISLYDPEVYVGGTYFGKTDVFKELNGFKKMAYASDSEFLERALVKYKVVKIDAPTYIYHRDHRDSATYNIERIYKTK